MRGKERFSAGPRAKRVCVRTQKETADLSTPLRSGRDDKFVAQCASAGGRRLPLNNIVISTRAPMDLRPTQRDEKDPPIHGPDAPIDCSSWKRRPPLCHPERSEVDLQFSGPFLEMFFDRAYPDFLPRSPIKAHGCGSPQREPHASRQRHRPQQEIRGSGVERSSVSFLRHRKHALPKHSRKPH
jgi:hypothetical protein